MLAACGTSSSETGAAERGAGGAASFPSSESPAVHVRGIWNRANGEWIWQLPFLSRDEGGVPHGCLPIWMGGWQTDRLDLSLPGSCVRCDHTGFERLHAPRQHPRPLSPGASGRCLRGSGDLVGSWNEERPRAGLEALRGGSPDAARRHSRSRPVASGWETSWWPGLRCTDPVSNPPSRCGCGSRTGPGRTVGESSTGAHCHGPTLGPLGTREDLGRLHRGGLGADELPEARG